MPFALPPSNADPRSWALVTAYKAASSYVGDLLSELFRARAVPQIDLAGYAFANGREEAPFCIENQHLLRTPGYYFGPFRDAYISEMLVLREISVIAHIRDPRDCLVSNHYSMAFSHVIPDGGPARDELVASRKLYSSRTVDQSVIADCPTFLRIFERLRDLHRGNSDLYLSRYEDLVSGFGDWLDRLADFVDCGHLTAAKDAIKQRASFVVQENQLNHKRQVTPGDFRRKLTSDTQAALTEQLRDVLLYFDYSCEL